MRALVLFVCVSGCVPDWQLSPHDEYFQVQAPQRTHARPPSALEPADQWDLVLNVFARPIGRLASPARYLGFVIGGASALDVNRFGQVPDSSWFENRITRDAARALDDMDRGTGPAPGPLSVIGGKLQGVSPGMVVRDQKGVTWFVKFDPPAYPDMATGAEMVASRLMYAAGYHVPEAHLHRLDLSRLVLAKNARTRDRLNRDVPLTEKRLRSLLTNLNPGRDGRLRSLFSRSVPGVPLGPFAFQGVRRDDPNDRIPHERRRSLRGLWVFSAWLNNIDTRRQNTMDTFIEVPRSRGLGTVKHYLLDFGDALGSAGNKEKYISQGYEGLIDWGPLLLRALALGFYYPEWLSVKRSPYRGVGIFEADKFDPADWSPEYKNPAFAAADAHDTLWATSILAHFRQEHIDRAVAAAEFSEPGAAAYVATVLRRRQQKLLTYGLSSSSGLDAPRVENGVLAWTDLWNLQRPGHHSYRWVVKSAQPEGKRRVLAGGQASEARLALGSLRSRLGDSRFFTVFVRRTRPAGGPWLQIHMRATDEHMLVVGMTRLSREEPF